MISDALHHILTDRRREINAARQRKTFEDLVDNIDTALLELDEDRSAAKERALTTALDALKAHVLARVVEADGDTSGLPLDITIADGRTVREICADEIAAVLDVPRRAEDVADAERYVAGDRARIEEANVQYIQPLESALAADLAAVDTAKQRAIEAKARLAELKKKYSIG